MISYRFEEENHQAAAYDGDKLIGVCQYEPMETEWAITHTSVLDEYGGQGIARKLVLMVSDEADDAGMDILPVCSYAKKVLE